MGSFAFEWKKVTNANASAILIPLWMPSYFISALKVKKADMMEVG